MEIVKTFGEYVEKWSGPAPERARKLLKTGWEAQYLKLKLRPDKRLLPSDQYAARMMMDTMLKPLKDPSHSAIVSIFTPCEMLHEAGLHPYNVEAFSCFLNGSRAERVFLQQAENEGLSETLCSYHKTFIGAADRGVMPRPRCIVYTSLACDANLLTFSRLGEKFQVPVFAIDVPFHGDKDSVAYVEEQLIRLKGFLEEVSGKKIPEESLKERLARSRRTLRNYRRYQKERASRYVPADLVTPLYSGMTNNILLGTEAEERYTRMLLRDIKKAGPARGKRIYWMHTIPFWSEAVRKELCFSENAQIVGCELAQTFRGDFDPESPYEAMAKGWCTIPSTETLQEGSRTASAAPGKREPTERCGLTTGAASIPWGSPSLPKRNLRRKGSPFCSWTETAATAATGEKARPLPGWEPF